jgi:peptide/nickel transport system permease protein
VTLAATADAPPKVASPLAMAGTAIRRNPTIFVGAVLLGTLAVMALAAPWIAGDPFRQAPINRLRPPSGPFWFGTDQYGRDVFSRTINGARV